MKKLLVCLALFAIVPLTNSQEQTTKVYICKSSSSYAYHVKKNCGSLNRCKSEIVAISLEEAQKMGRKPCGNCSK